MGSLEHNDVSLVVKDPSGHTSDEDEMARVSVSTPPARWQVSIHTWGHLLRQGL